MCSKFTDPLCVSLPQSIIHVVDAVMVPSVAALELAAYGEVLSDQPAGEVAPLEIASIEGQAKI